MIYIFQVTYSLDLDELGQPKESFFKVVSRQPLKIRSWNFEALTLAQSCICKSKHFESLARSRRAIQENSKLSIFGNIFGLKS